MFKRFLYNGLPVSVLMAICALGQGFAVRAFAAEAASAPAIVAESGKQAKDCRPIVRNGGKIKFRPRECR